MPDLEKLKQITDKMDDLRYRMDAFMIRRQVKKDQDRKKMADARLVMHAKRLDDFAEAHHPRNANGIFITSEGEEGKDDGQLDPGSLSKRDPL
jgi:hypothetical protein